MKTFKYGGILPNRFVEIEMLGCPKCGVWFLVDTGALENMADIYCVSCGFVGLAEDVEPDILTQKRMEEMVEWGNQRWEGSPVLRKELLGQKGE